MESKKQKLLEVAERLFAERGFKGVSVRDITKEAKINVSAVSYYFKGKKGLYIAVFKELWVERAKLQRKYLKQQLENCPNLDAKSFVELVILSFLSGPINKYSKNHFALIQREILEPTDALEIVKKEAIFPMIELLSSYIEKVFPNRFSLEQKRLYAQVLIGISIHFCLVKGKLIDLIPTDNLVAFICDNITDLLIYGFMGIKYEI